jgi:hypothetical protein
MIDTVMANVLIFLLALLSVGVPLLACWIMWLG